MSWEAWVTNPMMSSYHSPVLLHESLEALSINPAGVYVDVTFGGGGHSREILKRLNSQGRLIAFDQDPDAVQNVPDDQRFTLVRTNFRNLRKGLAECGLQKVNGILADLGVSSHQFDTAERGFSIRFEGPLDMRMNPEQPLSAKVVLATYAQDELRSIFRTYGEVDNAGLVAKRIVEAREEKAINTVEELKAVLLPLSRRGKENQYLAKVFQALRIEVNSELDALKEMLEQAAEVLDEAGRLVVISYHSLEDRMVKNFFRSGSFDGDQEKDFYGNLIRPLEPVSMKAMLPEENEIELNPRARSAKMRVAEMPRKTG
jgi:16S rRNA (cytosine1402-N4)-methyltransferase